jgi:hypothetical protein
MPVSQMIRFRNFTAAVSAWYSSLVCRVWTERDFVLVRRVRGSLPFPRAGDEEEEGRVISLACTACSNGCFPRRLGFIALVWRGRSGAQDIRPCHAGFQNPVEIQSGLNFIIWSVFTEFIQIHRKISKIQSQKLDLTESEFEHCSCPCQWMPCIARHDQIAPGEAAM